MPLLLLYVLLRLKAFGISDVNSYFEGLTILRLLISLFPVAPISKVLEFYISQLFTGLAGFGETDAGVLSLSSWSQKKS